MTAVHSTTSDGFAVGRWHVALLAIIVAIAGAVRAYRIDATSVWCDELLSIHLSNGNGLAADRLPRDALIEPVPDLMTLRAARPAWRIWGSMQDDVHPPLYYIVLRLWRDVFGDSPTAIRSLSAVLGTLAVIAMFFAGREIAGTAAGLCVAAINAVASNHIYFGQEARMYALVLLLLGIALALILRIERLGFSARRGIGLAACALCAMLTLYLASTVLVASAIYVLIRFRGRDRAGTIASFVAAAICFAICWGPFFLEQNFHDEKTNWQRADPHGHLSNTLALAAKLPINQFGVPVGRDGAYAYAFAVIYVLPALFVRRRPTILLPWMAAIFVVGVPMGADLVRTTSMTQWPRYTILLIPTLSLAIVAMATQLPAWLRWTLPLSLAAFGAISLPPTYEKERYDFRNNARFAERASIDGDARLICISTWNEKFDSVLLLACQYYWRQPPQSVVFVESVAALERLPRSATGDRFVLMAGDRDAELLQSGSHYESIGQATRALGVGTVMTFRRVDAPTTRAVSGGGEAQ